MLKNGFTSLNSNLNKSQSEKFIKDDISFLFSKTINARVTDIILDENHPKFEQYGGWNGIGTIEFQDINYPTLNNQKNLKAFPLFPNIKNYPLINEIVLLIRLVGKNPTQDNYGVYYYISSLNIWNHPHHNAFPSSEITPDFSSESEFENPLYNTNNKGIFNEKNSIRPTKYFVGDHIIEGRFGNNIRLGNTSKNNNPWSQDGKDGDPILILSNGQSEQKKKEGWVPVIEDINNDPSSIFLTSKQKIPLQESSNIYNALDTAPKSISEFSNSQVILNGNRLVFNSKSDDILISSKKYINLSSQKSIGLNSKNKISLFSPKIRLGKRDANQSLVLGDRFMDQYGQLLTSLDALCQALEKEPLLKVTPTIATGIRNVISEIKNQLPNNLSKTSKTI